MKTLRLLCHTAGFALILTLGASLAHAQNFVSWVSGVGSDTNPCDRELPCRTFGGALAKTLAGGVINVLEPGTFPLVTITNSITIDGGGGQVAASEASFGQNAITVNAGANDVVILRNLRFDGFSGTGSGGANGIVCSSVGLRFAKIRATFEEPDPDEDPIRVDVDRPVEDIVAVIVHELDLLASENRTRFE